jgi:MFS family permease
MGIASGAIAPRALMTLGSLLAAVATQLFGLSGSVQIFFVSRTLEGLGASAVPPPLLAHVTDVTGEVPVLVSAECVHDAGLRAKVISYFEVSLLPGARIRRSPWRAVVASARRRRHSACREQAEGCDSCNYLHAR